MSSNGVTFPSDPVSGTLNYGTTLVIDERSTTGYLKCVSLDSIARRPHACIDQNLANRQQISDRLPTIMGLLEEKTASSLMRSTSHSSGGNSVTYGNFPVPRSASY